MVRVHFGPPLQRKEEWVRNRTREFKGETLWTRKAALGNSPVDCCNRRGFSAEKRVLGPPLRKAKVRGKSEEVRSKILITYYLLLITSNIWGFSSAGRAPALQAGGQRFDPANLHQTKRLTEVATERLKLHWVSWERFTCTLKTEHYEIMMQLWEGNSKG